MMIDWTNAQSIVEGIGVKREKAEEITMGVEQLSRDLDSFYGRPINLMPAQPKIDDLVAAMRFGALLPDRRVLRAYARHLWLQTHKPCSVYRGGRWRQMRELQRVQAKCWALVEADKATSYETSKLS